MTDKEKLDSFGLKPLEDMKKSGCSKDYMIRVSSGTSGSKPVFMIQNKSRDLGKEPLFSNQFKEVRRIVFFGGMLNARLSCIARFLFYLGEEEYTILAVDNSDLHKGLEGIFRDFKPEGFIGFPSFIARALSFIDDKDVLKNVRAIRFSGEMISDAQKELFDDKLPQATLENIYASAEVGYISGVSCSYLKKSQYHPYERVVIDIINQDEDGVGDLVVSYNLSPSIYINQYVTGDTARFLKSPCVCGDTITFELLGRRDFDFIKFLGGALYREKGIDLFSVCDSRFHYGCFHEFLGRAITEHGIDVIDRLSNACVNKFGERGVLCQHGIGHGLLSYLGYDLDTLTEALSVCRNLDEQGERDPVRGCEGGVYMEFNMRTMLDEEDEVRHLDDSSFPCSVLPTSFKEGCIFWQPQWWQENLMREQKGYSENEYVIYSTMGSWCREFTNDEHLLQSCFAGIGNFGSGGVDYELSAIANLCRNSSGGSQSHDLLCRIRGFLKTPTQKLSNQSSGDVCRGLMSTLERYCNEFISGRGDDTFIGDDGNVVKLSYIIYLKPLNLKTSNGE